MTKGPDSKPPPIIKDNKSTKIIHPDDDEIYRPIMLKMTCRGSLSFQNGNLNNKTKINRHKQQQQHEPHLTNEEKAKLAIQSSLPICQGLQSRIQPVHEYPPMKPHAALHAFTHKTSFYHPDQDEDRQSRSSSGRPSFGGRGGGGRDPMDMFSNTFRNNARIQQLEEEKKKQQQEKEEERRKKKQQQKKQQNLPYIVDTKWDELKKELNEREDVDVDISNFNISSSPENANKNNMKFIGTTDVYMLVLRPNVDGTSTGMEGMNGYGGNSTNSNSSSGIQHHKTIKPSSKEKSPFELPLNPFPDKRTPMYNSSASDHNNKKNKQQHDNKKDHGDKSDNEKNNNGSSSSSNSSQYPSSIVYALTPVNKFGVSVREAKDKHGISSCSATTVKLGILEIHMTSIEDEIEKNDDTNEDKNKAFKPTMNKDQNQDNSKNDNGDESLSVMTSIKSTISQSKTYLDKLDKVSDKIQGSMVQNAKFIKSELENDFLNRTIKASEKIVGNFGKTMTRIEKTVVDVYRWWADDDSGSDTRK